MASPCGQFHGQLIKLEQTACTPTAKLRNFEDLADHLHGDKIDVAKQMILMARQLDARVLLTCSSTSVHASAAPRPPRRLRGAVLGPPHQRAPAVLGSRRDGRLPQPRHRHRLAPNLRHRHLGHFRVFPGEGVLRRSVPLPGTMRLRPRAQG
ncbi:MAG: hypothetical protein U1F21_09775 [Sphaerotilus natans]